MIPPWLLNILVATGVTDVLLQSSDVFVDAGQGLQRVDLVQSWSELEKRKWVVESLAHIGRGLDAKHPFVDFVFEHKHEDRDHRFRVHAMLPPISPSGLLLSIRKLGGQSQTHLSILWKQDPSFELLKDAVKQGRSILIAGATGSGKTTLLNALLEEIPHSKRILALEEIPELKPDHPHFLTLLARPPNADGFGSISLDTLLKQTLRMRPDRIVLGECRGAEILELLQILNTGHAGAMATIHANSARDAIKRVELLCLLATQGRLSSSVIRAFIGGGLQWVIHVEKTGNLRKISDILQIEGPQGDILLFRPMIKREAYVAASSYRLPL